MSWEEAATVIEVKAPEKVEVTDKPKEEPVKTEEKVEVAEAQEAKVTQVVSQELMGKALKKQREKLKAKSAEDKAIIAKLEEENKRLKNESLPEDERIAQENARVTARKEFLVIETARGKKVYGEAFDQAYELITNQNDPSLWQKIQWAESPSDTLMEEAKRIADVIEYGSEDAKVSKLRKEIEAETRKKVEAEYAEKLKVLKNQPTDVSSVRTAGGNETTSPQRSTWATGKGHLPGR